MQQPEYTKEEQVFLSFARGVTFIEGSGGRGKTLSAVSICYNLKKLFGMGTISSFHLEKAFGDYQYMGTDDLVQSLKVASAVYKAQDLDDETVSQKLILAALNDASKNKQNKILDLKNKCILLDEAYLFMDSRSPHDKIVKLFGFFISMIRHYESAVIICAPRIDMIDKRVRWQVSRIAQCRPDFSDPNNKYIKFLANDIPMMRKIKLKISVNKYGAMYDDKAKIPLRTIQLKMGKSG